ncbi:uncharacterized protein LOC126651265 isoform X2 [Myiozetetes cayanensis]|uniref:uncharacterized protein LOC126651265 isoform X2 n=1 Tax=Myiozetetes cayanensis TaxID=478635 RepID=UPI00215E209B|nr:uncharacterized protein LOC126651265 isoform X2 [Myiozetetes cayanensis]
MLKSPSLICFPKQTSLIKRSISALEMNAFEDETTLNMSANFKTSMKELKVMKQWLAEPEAEPEIGKSSSTKHLLNQICNHPQSTLTDIPVEKMPTLAGQMMVTIMLGGALLFWTCLNTCLPMGSSESIPCFAFLAVQSAGTTTCIRLWRCFRRGYHTHHLHGADRGQDLLNHCASSSNMPDSTVTVPSAKRHFFPR